MKFSRWSQDDLLFVITILLPVVFAALRYAESDREMDRIARAQAPATGVVDGKKKAQDLRLAYAQSHGR
jgi:hypothetical protein